MCFFNQNHRTSPNCIKLCLCSKFNSTRPFTNPKLKFAYLLPLKRYFLFFLIFGVFSNHYISKTEQASCAKILHLNFVISGIKNAQYVIFKRFSDIRFSLGSGVGGIRVPKHVYDLKYGFWVFRVADFRKALFSAHHSA